MFTPNGIENINGSNYMKFAEGANRIRILKEPITGFTYWLNEDGQIVGKNQRAGTGGKPVRVREFDELPLEARSAVKGFAAMVVWNYEAKKIQILEIKQVGLMNSLDALASSKSWGDVTEYDVVITKKITGPLPMDVEYSVMPEPKTDVSTEILEAYNLVHINLNALYDGSDPFGESLKEGESAQIMDTVANENKTKKK